MKPRRKNSKIIGTKWAWRRSPEAVGTITSRGIDGAGGAWSPIYWWEWKEVRLPISRYKLFKYYRKV